MLVFLSKLLPQFLYPLGLALLLIAAALLLWRRKRLQRAALLAALALLFLAGNRWAALGLTRALESRYPPLDLPVKADAIVVLGGGTEDPSPPRRIPEVNGAGDRVIYAAWLYTHHAAPAVLVSGGLLDWRSAPTTPADDMAALLEMMDVPKQAIWLQGRSRNTQEDAQYSAELLRARGAHRILLVTSAWHMPRAVRLFQAQDLEVIPAPADYLVTDSEWNTRWSLEPRTLILNLLPNADNIALTTKMLKEYLGMVYYQIVGVE